MSLSRSRSTDGELNGTVAAEGTELALDECRPPVLNPGSVGQPRDGDPRAAWLELDFDAGSATFGASRTTSPRRSPSYASETSPRPSPNGWRTASRERLERKRGAGTGVSANSSSSPNVMPSRASASWTSSRAL